MKINPKQNLIKILRYLNKSSQSSKKKNDENENNKLPTFNQKYNKDKSIGNDNKPLNNLRLAHDQQVDEGVQFDPNELKNIVDSATKKDIGTQFTFEDGKYKIVNIVVVSESNLSKGNEELKIGKRPHNSNTMVFTNDIK